MPPNVSRSTSLATLDWLRGIAAFLVMLFHYFQHSDLHVLFSRAFIAVDFFFMLSGFVLAYRYGTAIPTTGGTRAFVFARLVRLYPLYLVGAVLGAGALLVGIEQGATHDFSTAHLEVASALAIVFMPYLGHFHVAVGNGLIASPAFPLNVPAWSLFFELGANAVFAAFVFSLRSLLVLVLVAFSGLCLIDFLLADSNIGWGYAGFIGGLPRVGACFFAGVLLERVWRAYPGRRVHVSPLALVAVLAIDLSLPNVLHLGFLHYLLSIAIIFPALIFAGARDAPPSRIGGVLSFLGRISYALYMVHYPVLQFMGALAHEAGIASTLETQIVVALASSAAALGLATLLTYWFDEPVGTALGRRPRGLDPARQPSGESA